MFDNHCNHERVCDDYESVTTNDNETCKIKNCPFDTRPLPASDAPANPCEENGCTDIENCDEICEHQRVYSPAWVKEHEQQVRKNEREKVLDKLVKYINSNSPWVPGTDDRVTNSRNLIATIKSLRGAP